MKSTAKIRHTNGRSINGNNSDDNKNFNNNKRYTNNQHNSNNYKLIYNLLPMNDLKYIHM